MKRLESGCGTVQEVLDRRNCGRRKACEICDVGKGRLGPEERELANQSEDISLTCTEQLPERAVVGLYVMAEVANQLLDIPFGQCAARADEFFCRINYVQRVPICPGAYLSRSRLKLLFGLVGVDVHAQSPLRKFLAQVMKHSVARHGRKLSPGASRGLR